MTVFVFSIENSVLRTFQTHCLRCYFENGWPLKTRWVVGRPCIQ